MKSLRHNAVTLLELLVAIALMGILILSFSSIDLFSRHQVLTSDRRAKLQNEVSYALEQMSKNVMQGTGNISQPPLVTLANDGFQVRVDLNSPSTPADLSDDTWVSYTLSSNTLSCSLNSETLSTHIVPGVVFDAMPSAPSSGFYIKLADNNTSIEIGLVARYTPNSALNVDNPQVAMKAHLYARGSSAQ